MEKYKAFWNRDDVERPLVGFSLKSWFPLEEFAASAAWKNSRTLTPEMIRPEEFMDDQERLLQEGEYMDDDIFRGASPSQAVPWLDGILGNELRILPGSVLAEEKTLPWEELENLSLDRENPWFKKYIEFTGVLVKRAAGRFPVSHGTLHGPSDMLADLRGHTQSLFDLVDTPQKAEALLWKAAQIFVEVKEEQSKHIPAFCGGYFDAQYQLWAPGQVARLQEDATGLFSPEMYRKFLQPVDREMARHFPYSFMHLHSTSMFILDSFLEVEEIRCFEINNDVAGPPIKDMVPYFQMVQKADRPLLIRGSFTPDELRILMDSLDPRGLYMYIMVQSKEEADSLRPILGM